MKRVKFSYLFAVYVAVVTYICMFMIYPAHDDWGYTGPHPSASFWTGFIPRPEFWRPFDRLIEYGLGYAPYLFPYANHFVVLTGHFALCLTLYAVLRKLTGNNRFCSITGTLFFCLSPAIVQTVTNSDFINQVWAMTTGLISTFFFFKADISRKKRYYALWLICAFVSVLTKESGIVWFIAPVMLNTTYSFMKGESLSSVLKRNFVYFLLGIAGMILYFAMRFYLIGGVLLGSTAGKKGQFLLNFSPLNIMRAYSLIIGGAVTSMDSLAVFLKPRNFPIIIITGITSVIFLCFVLSRLLLIFRTDRRRFFSIVMLFVCAGYISSPYAVMGHNSEATAYEMTFMIGLMLGMILHSGGRSKFRGAILAAMFACMILSSGHKIFVMHEYTLGVHNFLEEHAADFSNTPKKAYVYFIEDIPEYGYATYKYTMGHGLNGGYAFNSVWGWRTKFTINHVSGDVNIDLTPDSLPEYDTVFSLSESGKLNVLRN